MPGDFNEDFTLDSSSHRTSAYFDLQAYWGITEHMGGLAATRSLLKECRVQEGADVLDIGCGVGITPCFAVRDRHCYVTGIDNNAGMIRNARSRVIRERLEDRIKLSVADAVDLPFADGCFDAVVVESVTSFVKDKRRALDEFARVLRPKGYLGLNELTWLEDERPELAEYLDRAMGASPLHSDQWLSMLEGAGLDPAEALVDRVRYLDQIKNEFARHSPLELATTWSRFISLYLRDQAFRRYVKKLAGAPRGFFRWLGYGLYVGRKP